MLPLQEYNPFIKHERLWRINSSIVEHNKEIYCVYRSDNLYTYNGMNWLVKLDPNFRVINAKFLIPSNHNQAFEDVRLISYEDLLFGFYTYLPYVDGNWQWRFGVGFGIIDTLKGCISHQISLRKLDDRVNNKNWVPYVHNKELYLISDFQPFLRILKVFGERGNLVMKEEYKSDVQVNDWEYGQIRGGTPLLASPNKNEFVYGFVHSYLSDINGYARYYFYTVIRLNCITKIYTFHPLPFGEKKDFIYERNSFKQTSNKSLKVIFPIGIMNHKNGLIVSFGVDDISSSTQFFTWNYILKLFK